MENGIEIRTCSVNGVTVEGKDYSELAINYFTELMNQNKKQKSSARLQAYIKYFVKTFKLEQSDNQEETFVTNNRNFYKLIKENVGDSRQISKAFVLLANVDRQYLSKNYLDAMLADFKIMENNKEIQRNIVLFTDANGEMFVIDFLLLSQTKKKEQNNMFLIPLQEYFNILRQSGFKFPDENTIEVNFYLGTTELSACYKNLMLSEQDLNLEKNKRFKRFFKRTFKFENPYFDDLKRNLNN